MNIIEKHLVLGASPNKSRYSNKAVIELKKHGFNAIALGFRKGTIGDTEIKLDWLSEKNENVHTITLYLNAARQKDYYNFIFNQNPKRLIFNPGAENRELTDLAERKEIVALNACTLVMLSLKNYNKL